MWEDTTGALHLVEGWRAYLAQGEVRWFVASSDFRKGPFRWLVYDEPNGHLLATSERFWLPAFRGDVVFVLFTSATPGDADAANCR
jgi:hypothetical protein